MRALQAAIAVTLLTIVAPFAELAAQTESRPPSVERSTCEGEGCRTEFRAVITQRTSAYRTAGGRAIAFAIPRGDTVDVKDSEIHHLRFGVVAVRKAVSPQFTDEGPPDTIPAGDTVPLMSYQGEGVYRIWWRGRMRSTSAFWDDYRDSERWPDAPGVVLDEGAQVRWYLLTGKRGRRGWIRGGDALRAVE